MNRRPTHSNKTVVLFAAVSLVLAAQQSEFVIVKIRSDQEKILNKPTLDRIKKFILRNGSKCTYSQAYVQNPCFETVNYWFYLNPDPGGPNNNPQYNIECDPRKGDFNILVIRRKSTGKYTNLEFQDQYRQIDFREEFNIRLTASDAHSQMHIGEIRNLAEKSITEILHNIEASSKSNHN